MKFESKLETSQDFLINILESMNTGIMTCDEKFGITFINKRMQQIYGIPDGVASEDWHQYIKIFEVDGLTPLAEENLPIVRALRGETIVNSYNYVVTKDKEPILVKNNAHPFYNDGKISGAILTTEDSQDLAYSHLKFKAIFEQSPLSIQILDQNGKTVIVNSAFQNLWSISTDFVQDYILKKYNILEDPLLIESGEIEKIRKAYQGEIVHIPKFYYDPSKLGLEGRARWASGMMYPLKNPAGGIQEVVVVHQDCTDEHNATEERQKLLAQLEAIVTQMPAGIMVSNKQGDVLIYNEQMNKLIGDSSKAKFVFDTPLKRSLQGDVIKSNEISFANNDGQVSVLATSSSPVHNSHNEITASIVISYDITQEKKAESNQIFLTQVKSILIATLDYDKILERIASSSIPFLADGCMIDIVEGDVIKRIITKHKDPKIQDFMTELQLRFPPHFNSPQPTVKAIKSGKAELIKTVDLDTVVKHTFSEEHRELILKIGIKTHIAVPLLIRGKVIGAINLFNSNSRTEFDEKDFVVAQDLARYASVAIDNATLYKEAKSAVQLRDDFISIASHELRTPITSLHLQVEVLNSLLEGLDEKLEVTPVMKKFLNNTNNQLKRLTRLVDDMLDISRISTGKLNLNFREVNLSLIVRDVIDRLQDHLQSHNIEIKILNSKDIFCYCDQERIDQVITNFMTNAIRYGRRQPIHIILDESQTSVFFKIKDHGRGIDKSDHKRIFNRFERAHTDEDVDGLGLGLYINQQIIGEHGGIISVESELKKGSIFSVELPKNLHLKIF